jgi:taurine dioxygenase
MSELNIKPLSEDLSFGARITGVTWDNVKDEAVRAQIAQTFEDAGVVVFAELAASSEMQVELAGILGPLRHHAMANVPRAEVGAAASLMELHNDPADQNLFEVDGKVCAGFTPWHYDACYAPEIYRGGVLRALEISPEGGRTGFADGVQLYQAISPGLRAQFEDLEIVYDPGLMHDRQKFGLPKGYRVLHTQAVMTKLMDSYRHAPRSVHPAIWRRKDGKRVIHVSPWQAAGIFGRENAEGDALLEALCQEMTAVMRPYWHSWNYDEIVAWDNWRTIHAVSGHDPKHGRKVHRATIEGDYGLGRAEFPDHEIA